MTKAEARQYIIDHCNPYYPQGDTKWDDAMNTAIKALELSENDWIPDSKPPTENGPYLVWMPFTPEGHHITVAEWCGSYWNIKTPITKWTKLPEP